MNPSDFERLQAGDVVRNDGSGQAYIVVETDGKRVIASRTIEIANPEEWTIVCDCNGGRPEARLDFLEETIKLVAYQAVIEQKAPWEEIAYRFLWERYGFDRAMAYDKAIRAIDVLKEPGV